MRFPSIARLAIGLAMALAALTGASAQMAPANDQPVTITFYSYNLATAGIGADATKKMVAEFMALHPNVTVNAVGVDGNTLISRVQADLAAGNPPDVAQLIFSDLDFIVHTLGAQPLEDIVPADELKAHFDGMSEPGLQLGVMDGRTYGLAYTFSTPVLFYNADLFRAAGLDPDKPPRTWDEVRDYAVRIKEATGKGIYLASFGALTGDWIWQSLVYSAGGQVLSDDRTKLQFAGPAGVKAATMLRGLVEAGVMDNLSLPQMMEGMASGNMAMQLNSTALNAYLVNAAKDKFELRAAPEPSFGDMPAVPTNSGSALFILTPDAAKQRAAWELMKFLTGPRGYTIITSEIGYLPLRPAIVDDPQYLKDYADSHPVVRLNLGQLPRIKPWVSMPGTDYRQVQKMMMDGVDEAVFGEGDVGEALAAAQEQAQALIPQD